MTKQKSLVLLALVALFAIGLAALSVHNRESAKAATSAKGKLCSGLRERVNEVAAVQVTKGGKTLTLKREGAAWSIVERGGYPAQSEKVKETVMGLAELEIEETKTKKPENWKELGLEDPTAEGAESALLVLLDATGAELASVVVGDTVSSRYGKALYARRSGEDQCWQVAGKLAPLADPTGWVVKDILKLAADRVQSARILHADHEEVLIERVPGELGEPGGNGKFVVANMPPEAKERYENVGNSIASALSYLTLDDVKPAAEVDFTAEPVATATYRASDGLVIEVQIAKLDGKTWARFDARFEAPPQPLGPTPPAEGEAGAASDPMKDAAALAEKTETEARDLAAKLSPWAYAIPSYRSDSIAKRMKDLIEEPSPVPEAAEDSLDADMPPSIELPTDDDGAAPTLEVPDDARSEDEPPAPAPAPPEEGGG